MKFSGEPETADISEIARAIMYMANPSLLISTLLAVDIVLSLLQITYESTEGASFKIALHIDMNNAMMQYSAVAHQNLRIEFEFEFDQADCEIDRCSRSGICIRRTKRDFELSYLFPCNV